MEPVLTGLGFVTLGFNPRCSWCLTSEIPGIRFLETNRNECFAGVRCRRKRLAGRGNEVLREIGGMGDVKVQVWLMDCKHNPIAILQGALLTSSE